MMNHLNRRAVSSSVDKTLVHVFEKQSRNDHQAHREMSAKTNFNTLLLAHQKGFSE